MERQSSKRQRSDIERRLPVGYVLCLFCSNGVPRAAVADRTQQFCSPGCAVSYGFHCATVVHARNMELNLPVPAPVGVNREGRMSAPRHN